MALGGCWQTPPLNPEPYRCVPKANLANVYIIWVRGPLAWRSSGWLWDFNFWGFYMYNKEAKSLTFGRGSEVSQDRVLEPPTDTGELRSP